MFKAEVLGKLPVAQHFLFGSLLPAPSHLPSDEMHAHGEGEEGKTVIHHAGHTHHVPSAGVGAVKTVGDVKGEMFGDCCGIPVPVHFSYPFSFHPDNADRSSNARSPLLPPVSKRSRSLKPTVLPPRRSLRSQGLVDRGLCRSIELS